MFPKKRTHHWNRIAEPTLTLASVVMEIDDEEDEELAASADAASTRVDRRKLRKIRIA